METASRTENGFNSNICRSDFSSNKNTFQTLFHCACVGEIRFGALPVRVHTSASVVRISRNDASTLTMIDADEGQY